MKYSKLLAPTFALLISGTAPALEVVSKTFKTEVGTVVVGEYIGGDLKACSLTFEPSNSIWINVVGVGEETAVGIVGFDAEASAAELSIGGERFAVVPFDGESAQHRAAYHGLSVRVVVNQLGGKIATIKDFAGLLAPAIGVRLDLPTAALTEFNTCANKHGL